MAVEKQSRPHARLVTPLPLFPAIARGIANLRPILRHASGLLVERLIYCFFHRQALVSAWSRPNIKNLAGGVPLEKESHLCMCAAVEFSEFFPHDPVSGVDRIASG